MLDLISEHANVYALIMRNHYGFNYCDKFDYASMAEDVQQFVLTHRLQNNFVLSGYCIGGRVAMHYTVKYSSFIKGLVLLESSAEKLEIIQGTNNWDDMVPFYGTLRGLTTKQAIEKIKQTYTDPQIQHWVQY